MLIEIAVGDAFGRPFEFASEKFVARFNQKGAKYCNRRTDSQLIRGVGVYTDDAQMSIAIAEHMLDGRLMTHEDYSTKFIHAYRRDPREGYSRRVKALLSEGLASSVIMLRNASDIQIRNSNGCMMRAVPLGLYPDPLKVQQAAVMQATVTHPAMQCVAASVYIALTSHWLYYHPNEDWHEWYGWMIEQMGPGSLEMVIGAYKGGKLECDALATTSFCIKNVMSSKSMTEILHNAIAITGDVDSAAAVSLGLASMSNRCINDLPQHLYDDLENGTYGRDYILSLDERLKEKYPQCL